MKFVHCQLRRAVEVFPLATATTPAVPTVTAALRAPDSAVRLPCLPGLRRRRRCAGDPASVQYPKSSAPPYHPYPVKPPFRVVAEAEWRNRTEIHQIVWPQMEAQCLSYSVEYYNLVW